MDHRDYYEIWIKNEKLNSEIRKELLSIQDNDYEIKDRFFSNLKFGTGGLRGIIGVGTNRINVYTVRKATQGLANYVNNSSNKFTKSVAIAYDSRHYSKEFAEESALVLAANGIKAFLFDSLRPTPELSFAVRHLYCDAGIVITASHNPPEYNGYKVYGADGGQITLEVANFIIAEINKTDIFNDVKTCTRETAIENGLFTLIGEDIDIEYLKKVVSLSTNPTLSNSVNDFKVVYTPIHGTGLMLVKRALSMLSYENIFVVSSQAEPDGDFPTVKSPNPEEREALNEGIKLAESLSANIVLGTDPDSDRVGVAVKTNNDSYELLTGNQIGALLTHYLISKKDKVSSKDAIIKTIVTSELGAVIAKSYGATVFDTLTGFKYIGEKIADFEKAKDYDFLFGYEESYGYLAGTFVRDKDAIISIVLIIEMATYYHLHNKTLVDVLNDIYKEYGYYSDLLDSFKFVGFDGKEKIRTILEKFNDNELIVNKFNDIKIIENYSLQSRYLVNTSKTNRIDLPQSKVIKIVFKDDSWFALRPSGTEPKLKIYYSAIGQSNEISQLRLKDIKEQVTKFLNF